TRPPLRSTLVPYTTLFRSWPESERVDLKHTIRVLDEDEAAQVMARLPYTIKSNDRLVAAVQQTMTRRGLDVNQPFRVLYVGDSRSEEHTSELQSREKLVCR